MIRIITAIGAAFILFTAPAALACSCVQPDDDIIEVLREGAIVAEGTIKRQSSEVLDRGFGRITYTFNVSKSLNKALPRRIEVSTANTSAACGVPLKVGRQAILQLFPDGEEGYSFNLCGQLAVDANREDWETLFNAIPGKR